LFRRRGATVACCVDGQRESIRRFD
jgi:hypothetical protein